MKNEKEVFRQREDKRKYLFKYLLLKRKKNLAMMFIEDYRAQTSGGEKYNRFHTVF